MSNNNYEKTQWVNGVTIVSAERLNKVENELEKSCMMYNSLQERTSILESNVQTIIEHINNSGEQTPETPVKEKKLVANLYEGASDRFYTMDFDYKGVLYKKTNNASTVGNVVENKEDFLMKKATAQLATTQTTFVSPLKKLGEDQYVDFINSSYTKGTKDQMTTTINLAIKDSTHQVVENVTLNVETFPELRDILNLFGDKQGFMYYRSYIGMLDDMAIFKITASCSEYIFPFVDTSSNTIIPNRAVGLDFLLFYNMKTRTVDHVTDITSVEELKHPFIGTVGLTKFYAISDFFEDGSTFILHDSKRYKALKNDPTSMKEIIPEKATNFRIMGVDITTGYTFENNLTTPAFARYTLEEM